MKILVTGSTGFLGGFLCKELQAQGHAVTLAHSKNCDLRQADSLRQFDGVKFDQIFHLAAWTQAGDFCLHHLGEQWIINQKINTNVLDWWHSRQPQAKLIAMGTSCSYDPALPLSEDFYLQGEPIESLFTYAMTKRMLLSGLKALSKQYGLQYLYLVPSTLYGPGYHTDGRQMHFIFDLIRKILRGKWYGEQVELWGDGEQKRELVHVRDFVGALLRLNETESNTHINIGSGKEHSIKEFASSICQAVDFPFEKIVFDTSKYVGARSKVLNVEKMHRALPDFSWTELSDGLRETIDWFIAQREVLLPEKVVCR